MKNTPKLLLLLLTGVVGLAGVLVLAQGDAVQAACAPLPSDKGQAVHSVTLPVEGRYTIWLRMLAGAAGQDSIYVKVDNQCPVIAADKVIAKEFTWVKHMGGDKNQPLAVQLGAGTHTITLAGKEAGVGVDKVILSSDPTCVPVDKGDNCVSAASAVTGNNGNGTPAEEGTGASITGSPATNKWVVASGAAVIILVTGFTLLKYLYFVRLHGGAIFPHDATFQTKLMHFTQQHKIIVIVCGAAFIGAITVVAVFAITPPPAFEVETAKLSGGASVVKDNKAAGGKYVRFDNTPAGTSTQNNSGGENAGNGGQNNSSGTTNNGGNTGGNSGGGNPSEGSSGGSSGGNTTSCALPNYPNETCTGVPAGTSLSVINSDVTIRTAGTVIENKDIRGCMIVQAPNVTIRKSKITCTSYYAIASYDSSDAGGLVVEDVEIDCNNHNTTGISFEGTVIRRAHIHGCENGLDINRNVTLTDSYIHSIYEGATGHGDGIQSPNGSNSTISHNTIYSESTTASININHNANGPTTSNVTISDNLLAGGAYTVYCPIKPTVNFKLINNRFSRIFHTKSGAFGATTDCQNEQASGNVWHDTGLPISL